MPELPRSYVQCDRNSSCFMVTQLRCLFSKPSCFCCSEYLPMPGIGNCIDIKIVFVVVLKIGHFLLYWHTKCSLLKAGWSTKQIIGKGLHLSAMEKIQVFLFSKILFNNRKRYEYSVYITIFRVRLLFLFIPVYFCFTRVVNSSLIARFVSYSSALCYSHNANALQYGIQKRSGLDHERVRQWRRARSYRQRCPTK